MRIHPTSDWHVDIKFNEFVAPAIDTDVVVVHCGDLMAPGTLAIPALRASYPDQQHLIYVLGNHDFYSDHRHPDTKTTFEEQRQRAPEVAAAHGVTLLDDAVAEIDGVRFIGSTLWSDFLMRPPYIAFAEAQRRAAAMNDYRLIKVGRGRSKDLLRTRDTIDAHKVSRRFIQDELAKPFDGETIVVTHHAPSRQSLRKPESLGDLDWCYASDLEAMMTGPDAPALWLHGHIHNNRDYIIGGTRVVANPRGYPAFFVKNSPRENPEFDPSLTVEVGLDLTPRFGM